MKKNDMSGSWHSNRSNPKLVDWVKQNLTLLENDVYKCDEYSCFKLAEVDTSKN